MRLRSALLVLAAGCAGLRDTRPPGLPVPDDLRDAPAAVYPPADRGEALYRWMLALEPGRSAEAALLLSPGDRELLERHIVRTKGREAYWSWRFELGPGLPERERAFIRWYLGAFTPYAAADGP